ncbi:hypothetical protein AKO1_005246, partial [Acrasis kona]
MSTPPNDLHIVTCSFFANYRTCRNGSKCRFSHDLSVKNRLPICSFFQKGFCKYGEHCRYAHIRNVEPPSPVLPSPTNTKKSLSAFCQCPIKTIEATLNNDPEVHKLNFIKVADFSRHMRKNFIERVFHCELEEPYPVFTFPQSGVSITIKKDETPNSMFSAFITSYAHRYCVLSWLEHKLQVGFCLIADTRYTSDVYYAVSVSISEYRSLLASPLKSRMQVPLSLPSSLLQRKKGAQLVEKLKKLPADQLLVKILEYGCELPLINKPTKQDETPLCDS